MDKPLLNFDCIYFLCKFLDDITFIRLKITCKDFNNGLSDAKIFEKFYNLSTIYYLLEKYKYIFDKINYDYIHWHPDDIPKTIKYMKFVNGFYNPVHNIPSHITHVDFGERFNKSINKLSDSIIYLILGDEFNSEINKD